jgi:hypothetical protein
MEEVKQAVSEESGQTSNGVQNNQQGQAAKVNLDSLPEFQKFRSNADKRASELEKRLQKAEEERLKLEEKMEALISDPNAKAQFKQQRQEAELDRLRSESQARKAMKVFATEYGVPVDIFDESDSPADMTSKALRWQKQQLEASKSGQSDAQRASEVQQIEKEGGHVVSKAIETPAELQTSTDIQNKIKELRAIALKGGSAAQRARSEILKLQDEARKPVVKAKV